MKKLFVATPLLWILSTVAAPVRAKDTPPGQPRYIAVQTIPSTAISPYELVARGYQGHYQAQGIAGFATFKQQAAWGRVTAKSLVNAAIAYGDLPEDYRTDRQYLNQVEMRLWSSSKH
jgi:hypothetical protein